MLDNLEKKIIKEIESGRVKPLSHSFFLAKKIAVWLLIFVFLVFAGLSLAILALIIRHGDWDIYLFLESSPAAFFFHAFPYFWLFGALVFLVGALYRTRRTDGAYSHPFIYHGLAGLSAIFIVASIFYFSGLGQKTEAWLAGSNLYRQANYLRSSWENPNKGLLAGTLKSERGEFILRDFNGRNWNLIFPEGEFPGSQLLFAGEKIKLIGHLINATSSDFFVEQARPWECGCQHCAHMERSCQGCSPDSCSGKGSCSIKK